MIDNEIVCVITRTQDVLLGRVTTKGILNEDQLVYGNNDEVHLKDIIMVNMTQHGGQLVPVPTPYPMVIDAIIKSKIAEEQVITFNKKDCIGIYTEDEIVFDLVEWYKKVMAKKKSNIEVVSTIPNING